MKLIVLSTVLSMALAANNRPLYGVSYNPYGTNGCASQDEVDDRMMKLSKLGSYVRLYRSSCGQVEKVVSAIHKNKLDMKVFAGIWTREGDNVFWEELNSMKSAFDSNPEFVNYITAVSVGNEELHNDPSQKANLIEKINIARKELSKYRKIPVGTSDVDANWDKEVANNCDFVGANIQPYWSGRPDTNTSIDRSVEDIQFSLKTINEKNLGKPVFVTEVGFPSGGAPSRAYGSLSEEKQFQFLKSVRCRGPKVPYFVMDSFDANFKDANMNGGVERHFGIMKDDGNLKFADMNYLMNC